MARDRVAQKVAEQVALIQAARTQLKPLDASQHRSEGLSLIQVTERRVLGLNNQQNQDSSRSFSHILRANLFTLFNAVVGGSFLLLLVLGQWKDALFGFAVVANVLIGITQEFISKRTLDKLAVLNQPFARVRRAGEITQINLRDLVLDDLLELRAGDQVLADAKVLDSAALEIDEALLTGEAEPIFKSNQDEVLAGSLVVAGKGSARVIRVGSETYASRLVLEARRFSLVKSELRNALNRIIRWITWALLPVMAIIVNGQMQAVGGWRHAYENGEWLTATVASIAAIISMVPQGLVLITSIAFAVAALKLSRRQVLLQELFAVEGLARVDLICFDKTGTLTEGDIAFDSAVELEAPKKAWLKAPLLDWRDVLVHFADDPDANATAKSLRMDFAGARQLKSTSAVPFDSTRKWSSFSFEVGKGSQTWVLGAPELVLDHQAKEHQVALKAAADLAESGLRTLVLAASQSGHLNKDALPKALHPVAILTFKEKVRADAAQTVAYFHEQGVQIRIISGDNPKTVAAVAREAGVKQVGDGIDGRNLPTEIGALADVLETNQVFGRITPEQKRNMVAALQSRGHVVAMTGDGVNDVLALKLADLGIAMGSGAAATKAVANLILLDGNFSSLPGVVAEGRRVIANIERVSRLFLTKTTWAMTLAITFGALLWTFPFLPRQISAIDGFTIGLPSLVLAVLPNNRRYLPGFLRRSLMFCIPAGLIIAVFVVWLDIVTRQTASWNASESQTAVAILMSITGLWVLTALARPLRGWTLWVVISMFGLCILEFTVPIVKDFFGFATLTFDQLLAPVGLGVLACMLIEAVQHIVFRMNTKKI